MTTLPPTGSKICQLLVIATEDFELTIKGKAKNETVESFKLHLNEDQEFIRAKVNISPASAWAKVYNPLLGELTDYHGEGIYPCFFERTDYEIIIERLEHSRKELSFYHDNANLKAAVTPTGKQGRILSGVINFGDEVGFSRFEILGDRQSLLSVELDVFPSKLDYRKDFWQLLSEVNTEVYNLAFDFLKKTYFAAALKNENKPSQAEFFYIIQQIYDSLLKAFNRTCSQPHHKISLENRLVKPEKIKRADAKTSRWLAQRPHLFEESTPGISITGQSYLPRKVLHTKKTLTYDTFENRILKWIIWQITGKLKSFKNKYSQSYGSTKENQIVQRVDLMVRELNRLVSNSFLAEVGSLPRLESSSLVLQLAPGYREVYKYYLMLQKGLNIKSDLFKLSIKDLAELYEYWCFLKINSLLRNKYSLIRNNLLKVDRTGITVNLVKGRESELTYLNPYNNEQFKITYNPTYKLLPTVAQKPDNVLTLEKNRSRVKYQYVFDAKYRITADKKYLESYRQAGPPEDTINAMHRYRDALVTGAKNDGTYERNIFGAFVLFPHNDELKYAGKKSGEAHKFYESIKKISIGAIPFLPSQTNLMEEFLDELVLESPDTAFERAVVQEGTGDYLLEMTGKKNVLLGPLRTKEQLPVCLAKNFYYAYLSTVQSFLGELEYVAIYQSKRLFKEKDEPGIKYYGKISNLKIMKREELKEIPARYNHKELIVKFYIEDWLVKSNVIEPGGYGPSSPQRTSWQLFQEAKSYPELHLKNTGEIRLWRELRRLKDKVMIKFPREQIKSDDNLVAMEISGLTAERTGDDSFKIKMKEAELDFSFAALNQRPGHVINEIIKRWRST